MMLNRKKQNTIIYIQSVSKGKINQLGEREAWIEYVMLVHFFVFTVGLINIFIYILNIFNKYIYNGLINIFSKEMSLKVI